MSVKGAQFFGVSLARIHRYDVSVPNLIRWTNTPTRNGVRDAQSPRRGAPLSRRITGPVWFECEYDKRDITTPHAANVMLEVEWNFGLSKYEVVGFHASRKIGGEAITSRLLRSIPVGEIAQEFVRLAVSRYGSVDSSVFKGRVPDAVRQLTVMGEALQKDRLTEEKLEWVALGHELSSTFLSNPAQDIARHFGVSLRTATNWIKAARDEGFLSHGHG